MTTLPRTLLLSAYRADSHAWWADWLQQALTDRHWEVLELPGRWFNWRIRGNPLSWLDQIENAVDGADQVLATSMVDLATLRGLCPSLAQLPTLLYFHENQFAYPQTAQQRNSIEPQMIQLYAGLAADRLLFNSAWNQQSYLDGVERLLARFPDEVPTGIPARLAARCSVIPVPIENLRPADGAPPRDQKLIVWNHRWEHDKAPERFAKALFALADQGVEFRLALLGPRPKAKPPALESIEAQLEERIVANERLPRAEYVALLQRAGIVISTAEHEFQGLAMLEAVSAGATPLAPDHLVYPSQYPAHCLYPARDDAALADRLKQWLCNGPPPAPSVSAWLAEPLTAQWAAALQI